MQPPEARATTSQRPLALSGIVFAVLFLIGWFTTGGDAPDYGAPDQAVGFDGHVVGFRADDDSFDDVVRHGDRRDRTGHEVVVAA